MNKAEFISQLLQSTTRVLKPLITSSSHINSLKYFTSTNAHFFIPFFIDGGFVCRQPMWRSTAPAIHIQDRPVNRKHQ